MTCLYSLFFPLLDGILKRMGESFFRGEEQADFSKIEGELQAEGLEPTPDEFAILAAGKSKKETPIPSRESVFDFLKDTKGLQEYCKRKREVRRAFKKFLDIPDHLDFKGGDVGHAGFWTATAKAFGHESPQELSLEERTATLLLFTMAVERWKAWAQHGNWDLEKDIPLLSEAVNHPETDEQEPGTVNLFRQEINPVIHWSTLQTDTFRLDDTSLWFPQAVRAFLTDERTKGFFPTLPAENFDKKMEEIGALVREDTYVPSTLGTGVSKKTADLQTSLGKEVTKRVREVIIPRFLVSLETKKQVPQT